jgi:hypothetical protein
MFLIGHVLHSFKLHFLNSIQGTFFFLTLGFSGQVLEENLKIHQHCSFYIRFVSFFLNLRTIFYSSLHILCSYECCSNINNNNRV